MASHRQPNLNHKVNYIMNQRYSNGMSIPLVLVDEFQLGDIPVVGFIDATTPDLKVQYTHRGFFLTMKAQTELAQQFKIPAPDAAPGIVTGMISNAPGAKDDCTPCAEKRRAAAAARARRLNGGK